MFKILLMVENAVRGPHKNKIVPKENNIFPGQCIVESTTENMIRVSFNLVVSR